VSSHPVMPLRGQVRGDGMGIFQSLLGGGNNALIGLDISSSAVKLLELSRRGQKYHVEAFAAEPLPPNAIVDKQVADPQAVGEAIARAVARAGTKTKLAAVAVAGSSVITKIISVPTGLKDADLEAQIRDEADQYIPYPIDEVNLDFQVLGPSQKNPDYVDVLLAACRGEQVEGLSAALQVAGLTPKIVDIEAYALENACTFLQHQMAEQGQGRTVAVVDMGSTTMSLLVLHDLHTVYTRDQAFGGKQLTEDIMRHYGMSYEEALKAKKHGGLPESYQTEVLPRFVDDMTHQIDRSLQFFFAAGTAYNKIDQLILAGGCAHIDNVAEQVQQRIGIPTAVARPFATMSVSSRAKPAVLAKEEATLLIAAGLAYRAFDEAH
jgi:type IV pilus assembly protein PilM